MLLLLSDFYHFLKCVLYEQILPIENINPLKYYYLHNSNFVLRLLEMFEPILSLGGLPNIYRMLYYFPLYLENEFHLSLLCLLNY